MKRLQSADDLALFGASPAFEDTFHVGRPNLVDRERLLERLGDIFDRRWFTNDGPYVRRLEALVADELDVGHCVAVSNATAGLDLVARALGLCGEVIVPSMTFVATAHAMTWAGLKPVFCDIDPATHNLSLSCLAECVTPRTCAILAVHLWGRPCDPEGLQAAAQDAGVELIFDAAHALGCSSGGRMIGSFGHAEVFSLHATKFVNSFEGGLVTTHDDALASELRLLRNFGFSEMDQVSSLGINAKMSEPSAAMGLTQLEGRQQIIAVNRANYLAYRGHLDGVDGVSLIQYDEAESNNFQYVVVEIETPQAGLTRDQLMAVLHAENVLARRYFYPGVHRMEPYASDGDRAWSLPETESLVSKVLVLPTGDTVDSPSIDRICRILKLALSEAEAVRSRLSTA